MFSIPCSLHVRVRHLSWFFSIVAALFAVSAVAADAPNGPGGTSHWPTSEKDFLGTSMSDQCRVHFTGAEGVVTEIFYPTLDNQQHTDLQFIVIDTGATWGLDDAEERKQKPVVIEQPDKRAMLWKVTTTSRNNKWKIVKHVFTDPDRNVLVERVTFETLEAGKTVSDFNVYVLSNPAINRTYQNDNGRKFSHNGRVMLTASESNSTSSALAISLPWKKVNGVDMVSSGFVGRNDGWIDLFGSDDRKMDWTYDGAFNGNVSQMGWLDFGGSTATSISFVLALGFGNSEAAAAQAADATLNQPINTIETAYANGWHDYADDLNSLGGTADDQYYLAAMTLKTCQDKGTGAMIAGAGTPWGEVRDNADDSYAFVWSRDLFKFASALLAAGDKQSARRTVEFLFNKQMRSDGHFPQKTYVNGDEKWTGVQMDQTAMPIILAWKLQQIGELDLHTLWPRIKLAANYLAREGPRTPLDRWEENEGFSPSTIAAEIAGLVCAASLAQAEGDPDAAQYLAKADEWRNNVAAWTFTTTGFHGDKRYFIRITHNDDPNDDVRITLKNHAGSHGERYIVDGGFLELVRMGAMSPNDWTILESIPEYDATIKQTINGHDAFFRYNYDGYGEENNGDSYRGQGRGRLWPIFTAERGIYEISKSGNGTAGAPYKTALKAFSSAAGFIPEQVFNQTASITGWQTDTPPGATPGTATRSIRPLNWAMGEYINLCVAMHSNKNDAPQAVVRRYDTDLPQATITFNVHAQTEWGQDVYLVGDHPLLSAWVPDAGIKLSPAAYPNWTTTISLPALKSFQYKFVKLGRGAAQWEGGGNRTLTSPANGAKTVSATFQ